MSFPKYKKYKPSGVEWLGDVPEGWEVSNCRSIVTERNERNENTVNENYLSLMANIGIIPYEDKGDVGNKKPDDLSKCKVVHAGDFVINSMNYYIGSYGVSPYKGVCSPVYVVMTPREKVALSEYSFRIFENSSFQEYAQSFGNGILEHRRSINWDIIKRLKVAVPPLPEQKSIASFLDVETSKIDRLVGDQRRLIELLKEKRQAVISHAVTKGLDPNAQLKPTGIEWLGDVPEGWSVGTFRTISNVVRGGSPRPAGSPEYFNGNYIPWVTVAEITKDEHIYLDSTETKLTQLGAENSRVFEANTLIYSNSGATLGVPKILDIKACANDGVVGFLGLSEKMNILFAYYYLLSIKDAIRDKIKQGSGQPNLNTDIVKALHIPRPSLPEQEAIASYLDEQTSKIDGLIAEAERSIELLIERRTALISAAVTGKIDVRGMVDRERVS